MLRGEEVRDEEARETRQKSRSFAARTDVLSRASFSNEVPNLSCLVLSAHVGSGKEGVGQAYISKSGISARTYTEQSAVELPRTLCEFFHARTNSPGERQSRITHAETLYRDKCVSHLNNFILQTPKLEHETNVNKH